MTNRSGISKGARRWAIAIVVLLPILSRVAMAGQTSGTLSHVQYFTGTSPSLILNFDNGTTINAWATTAGTNSACQVIYSDDTLKTFYSLALAAFLAGKSVNVAFTVVSSNCMSPGLNFMTAIDLPK